MINLYCMDEVEANRVVEESMDVQVGLLFRDPNSGVDLRSQVAGTSQNGELICAAVFFARASYERTILNACRNPAALDCMLRNLMEQNLSDSDLLVAIAKNPSTSTNTLACMVSNETPWVANRRAHRTLLKRLRGVL